MYDMKKLTSIGNIVASLVINLVTLNPCLSSAALYAAPKAAASSVFKDQQSEHFKPLTKIP